MARLIWSPDSLDDLAEIRRYIAKDAPRAAQNFVQRIFGVAERLQSFPRSGQIVPEQDEQNIREIHLKKYRIIYRVITESADDERVEIVTIQNGSRLLDLERLLP